MSLLAKYRAIRSARQVHPPDPADESGDAGEAQVLAEVQAFAAGLRPPIRCYHSLRVPRTDEKGKYEIDLFALSPFGLLALEVKNWGGQVDAHGDGPWARVNSRGVLQTPVEDPIRLVEAKAAAVAAYLTANGVAVPPNALDHALVLNNPRLRIGPQIERRPHLFRRIGLRPLLRQRLYPNRPGLGPMLRRLIGLEKATPPVLPNFAEVVRVLDRLPTWDAIALHGGRLLKGDIAGMGVQLASGKLLTRRDARGLRFRIPRSWIFGWFFSPAVSWTDKAGARRRERLAPGQVLTIRLAGRKEEAPAPIEQIETVAFGWEDDSYYRPEKPDLAEYRPGTVYLGTVTGVQEYGVFVSLDGRRDGLVHVSRLAAREKAPADYRRGQQVGVRVVRTGLRDEKERIDLDLE